MLGLPKLNAKSPKLSFGTHIVWLWCMICPPDPQNTSQIDLCSTVPHGYTSQNPAFGGHQRLQLPKPQHLDNIVILYSNFIQNTLYYAFILLLLYIHMILFFLNIVVCKPCVQQFFSIHFATVISLKCHFPFTSGSTISAAISL